MDYFVWEFLSQEYLRTMVVTKRGRKLNFVQDGAARRVKRNELFIGITTINYASVSQIGHFHLLVKKLYRGFYDIISTATFYNNLKIF